MDKKRHRSSFDDKKSSDIEKDTPRNSKGKFSMSKQPERLQGSDASVKRQKREENFFVTQKVVSKIESCHA